MQHPDLLLQHLDETLETKRFETSKTLETQRRLRA
jgi:hypothetical protein